MSMFSDRRITEGEVNSGELITVPDQSYTIEELLDKFSHGIVPAVQMQGTYDDDGSDSPAFVPDDATDVQERYAELSSRVVSERKKAVEERALQSDEKAAESDAEK